LLDAQRPKGSWGSFASDDDGVIVIPKDLSLELLAECERIRGLEDLSRPEFARRDDPVEVFKRYKGL
jgi:regulator of RNase E activity RraA